MDFGGASSPFPACAGVPGQALLQPSPLLLVLQPWRRCSPSTPTTSHPHRPPQSQPLWIQFQPIPGERGEHSIPSLPAESRDGFGGRWKTFSSIEQPQTFGSSFPGPSGLSAAQFQAGSSPSVPFQHRSPKFGITGTKQTGWLDNSQLAPSLFRHFWCFPEHPSSITPQANTLSLPREQFPQEGGEREAGKQNLGGSQATGCVPGRPGCALVIGLSIWE